MKISHVYLLLAILGALVPFIFFFTFFVEHGVDLNLFVSSLFVNGAAGGFSADLLITSVAFWVYCWEMHRRGKGPSMWPFAFLNLVIGLSFALPLYLFVSHVTRNAAAA